MVTYIGTEWRAKYFKDMNKKDSQYVQKATDSLLNFETVKYFNAEDHEQKRFQIPLLEYKHANIKVTQSMVAVNVTEGLTISVGLTISLYLAYMAI
jgi:ABC-type transport system involved in Fe-S cluster assembly fused permease/ATPase subunit